MGTAHAREGETLTNLEWLYSLKPDELKAWFESEHNPTDDEIIRLRESNERLACAVANYRDMLGE